MRSIAIVEIYASFGEYMKVIIAGSRSITNYKAVENAIKRSGFDITELVSGHANGVDKLGEQWAQEHDIPVKLFLPEWDIHGRRAGPIRNGHMAGYAQALVAVWDGTSTGTKDMIDKAKMQGLSVYIHLVY